MLSVTRSEARRGRSLIRKCLAGKPRGPAPPVWIMPSSRSLALVATIDDVTIRLPIACNANLDQQIILPVEALDTVEGASDDPVQVVPEATQITLHWTDRGLPRTQSFTLPESRETPPRLALPKSLTTLPPRFLHALQEAGRSTTREPQRYALQRVQVRGAAGEVIGTDAHFVVRFEGFTLPFEDEILVPAVSLFGLDEFTKAGEIRIGLTRQNLILVAGDVTVWLRLDRNSRYPDVARVIPKNAPAANVTLDDADALFLLDTLPTLPINDETHRPVTLDLGEGEDGTVVRAASNGTPDVVEVHLLRSPVSTGSQRLAVDRRYLIRLLALGCRTFQVFGDPQPMIATGDDVTTLVMPLECDLVVPPTKSARILKPDNSSQSVTPRSSPMKSVEPSSNGHAEGEALDPLAEAEALRNALTETLQRLGRLVTALRSRKKEQRALTQVWSSLKSLQLGS